MSSLPRILDLAPLLSKKSLFLFGPRATGKSWLVRHALGERAVLIDLLDTRLSLELLAAPHQLEPIVCGAVGERGRPWVVIDEIQKNPMLLDEVHRLIETRGMRFLLTGSSARKLRRGAANLLAGRAWQANLFPLVRAEIPHFDLERFLRYGGLPSVYLSENPGEELDAAGATRTYRYSYGKGDLVGFELVPGVPGAELFDMGGKPQPDLFLLQLQPEMLNSEVPSPPDPEPDPDPKPDPEPDPMECSEYSPGTSCEQCIVDSCCDQLRACSNDDSCASIMSCIQNCSDAACYNACASYYPAGRDKFEELTSCVNDFCSPCQ